MSFDKEVLSVYFMLSKMINANAIQQDCVKQ